MALGAQPPGRIGRGLAGNPLAGETLTGRVAAGAQRIDAQVQRRHVVEGRHFLRHPVTESPEKGGPEPRGAVGRHQGRLVVMVQGAAAQRPGKGPFGFVQRSGVVALTVKKGGQRVRIRCRSVLPFQQLGSNDTAAGRGGHILARQPPVETGAATQHLIDMLPDRGTVTRPHIAPRAEIAGEEPVRRNGARGRRRIEGVENVHRRLEARTRSHDLLIEFTREPIHPRTWRRAGISGLAGNWEPRG